MLLSTLQTSANCYSVLEQPNKNILNRQFNRKKTDARLAIGFKRIFQEKKCLVHLIRHKNLHFVPLKNFSKPPIKDFFLYNYNKSNSDKTPKPHSMVILKWLQNLNNKHLHRDSKQKLLNPRV